MAERDCGADSVAVWADVAEDNKAVMLTDDIGYFCKTGIFTHDGIGVKASG